MKPESIQDALRHIDSLLSAVMHDIDNYMENPGDHTPEYFRSVSGAAADARLLALWVRDNLTYPTEQ